MIRSPTLRNLMRKKLCYFFFQQFTQIVTVAKFERKFSPSFYDRQKKKKQRRTVQNLNYAPEKVTQLLCLRLGVFIVTLFDADKPFWTRIIFCERYFTPQLKESVGKSSRYRFTSANFRPLDNSPLLTTISFRIQFFFDDSRRCRPPSRELVTISNWLSFVSCACTEN
ncbi:hypothetical protein TNCV_4222561 [Trichonephila clavipes]|nr:hypothetical protein TNCV_4222561 [Trichonephila clavipes]